MIEIITLYHCDIHFYFQKFEGINEILDKSICINSIKCYHSHFWFIFYFKDRRLVHWKCCLFSSCDSSPFTQHNLWCGDDLTLYFLRTGPNFHSKNLKNNITFTFIHPPNKLLNLFFAIFS
jgi:hypothetical protein